MPFFCLLATRLNWSHMSWVLLIMQILHTKLSAKSDTGIKSAILYDGSITEFDSRLCGFDIGTCLEVFTFLLWYISC